jgi:hypothetical protein
MAKGDQNSYKNIKVNIDIRIEIHFNELLSIVNFQMEKNNAFEIKFVKKFTRRSLKSKSCIKAMKILYKKFAMKILYKKWLPRLSPCPMASG